MAAAPEESPSGGEWLEELLGAAREFAVAAGERTLAHYGTLLAADSKSDGTPVTIADREAEAFLREAILARFPDHGILGEEFGEAKGTRDVRWILDPIDGTRSFMRGVPLYAVLIGVEVEGVAAVGVAHFPALGETVSAARGRGCLWEPGGGAAARPGRVSEVRDLPDAALSVTDPVAVLASGVGAGWADLSRQVALVRGWGDAYGHVLVATGRTEVMVDPVLSAWDAAPLRPILEEAGGRFTDLGGEPTIHGGSGVSTNGHLHAEVLRVVNGAG